MTCLGVLWAFHRRKTAEGGPNDPKTSHVANVTDYRQPGFGVHLWKPFLGILGSHLVAISVY